MKPPVPAFVAAWAPAATGTVLRRPALGPGRPGPPPEPDRYEGVAYDACRVCGWRFSKLPTRCMCQGAAPRAAPPLPDRWTDDHDEET